MPPKRGHRGGPPQHRVYQPGKRHMELIASVSRSSGLEKDGDALRDPRIQEEYRAFIQGKLDDYWKKYPLRSSHQTQGQRDGEAVRNRREMEENLLILFRKLREGLLSTQRQDAFAMEVYETSLHLSILFRSPLQTTTALSHLFPDFYILPPATNTTTSESTSERRTTPGGRGPGREPASGARTTPSDRPYPGSPSPATTLRAGALPSTVIFLLHHLLAAHPSQAPFYAQLRALRPALQAALRAPPSPPPGSTPRGAASRPASIPPPATGPPPPSPPPRRAAAPPPPRAAEQASAPLSAPTPDPERERERERQGPGPQPLSLRPQEGPSDPGPHPALVSGVHARLDVGAGSAHAWLLALARCLRARNYARLDALARPAAFSRFAVGPAEGSPPGGGGLAAAALGALVAALLEKARGAAWDVLRTAYREVHLRAAVPVPDGVVATTTGEWLARSLALRVEAAGEPGDGDGGEGAAEAWLEARRGKGETRRREGEGMDGRWLLVRAC